MSATIPDTLVVSGTAYEIVEVDGVGLFEPTGLFEPEMISTGCGRGYLCTYGIDGDRLVLHRLALQGHTPAGERIAAGTRLLGGTVAADDSHGGLCLRLAWPVPFSGRLFAGDTWLRELTEPFWQPAWTYDRCLTVRAERGRVTAVDDVSDRAAALRRIYLAGEIGRPQPLLPLLKPTA